MSFKLDSMNIPILHLPLCYVQDKAVYFVD